MQNKYSYFIIVSAFLLTAACDGLAVQERPFGASLYPPVSALYVAPPDASAALLPEPADATERSRLADTNKLLDDFGARAQTAFTTEDAAQHLPGLERFYFATGRYLELVDIYRKAYDTHGPSHFVAPRLAWAYLSIGDEARADEVLQATLEARPRDPWVHFTYGYALGMRPSNDAQVGKAVYDAWSRALQLDPNFVGPQGVTADRIRERLDEMAKLLQQQGISTDVTPPPNPTPPTPNIPPTSPPTSPPTPTSPTDPASADPRLLEAESLLASSRANDAGKLFDDLLKAYPQSNRADLGRALAAWRSETVDRADAERMLRHVTQRPDLSARQAYELGVVLYRELKDPPAALALWRRAAALDPAFADQVRLNDTIARVAAEPAP